MQSQSARYQTRIAHFWSYERNGVFMFHLFGKKNTEVKKKKPVNIVKDLLNADLETIWSIEDKNHFLIAMDGWLSRKCQFGKDIEKLSEAEKVINFTVK